MIFKASSKPNRSVILRENTVLAFITHMEDKALTLNTLLLKFSHLSLSLPFEPQLLSFAPQELL